MAHHFTVILISYLLLGAVAGLLAGTIGIGGGVIVVPALLWLFAWQGFPSTVSIHLAVGTSLAAMSVMTARSFLGHQRHNIPYWPIFKYLFPGLGLGVLLGSLIGHYMRSSTLILIFGIVQLFLAIYMLFSAKIRIHGRLPGPGGIGLTGAIIGGFGGLLGIGGGGLIIPFLTYCRVSMREAVMISIATGAVVSIIGTVSVILIGLMKKEIIDMPWHTGYVYWPAWIGLSVGGLCLVPLGVKLSHRLPVETLRKILAVFLILVAIDLLIKAG